MSKHTFEHTGNYICTCGKTFTSSQKYNSHLSRCKIHLGEERYNANIKANKDALLRGIETQRKIRKEKAEKRILLARKEWEATDHYCEKCGKKIEYENIIGSGRFCSRSCSNSRKHSEDTKSKIGNSVKKTFKEHPYKVSKPSYKVYTSSWNNRKWLIRRLLQDINYFYLDRGRCPRCNKKLEFVKYLRGSKYCPKCRCLGNGGLMSLKIGRGNGGWYKGIYCMSTYELVYVIYNLDHDIKFKPCKRIYTYLWKNTLHKYHPDFELDDGTIIEIKGYLTDQDKAKINAVKDMPIKVLFEKDLQYAFEYVKENYSYKKLKDLYDK